MLHLFLLTKFTLDSLLSHFMIYVKLNKNTLNINCSLEAKLMADYYKNQLIRKSLIKSLRLKYFTVVSASVRVTIKQVSVTGLR